ncbi:putative RNA methyltransferase [Pseudobacter ginsenosidimutans]|uniref:23S rRNA m(1)G-748 methyltransferase n=1 Tax=Pseudobacter ginsenosidimutans TaxID=661488 RepID=A0A4Q7N655_9BACT|nr:methyltransferase domain-containing protein [Pseudobacter ginsenosidimutans]QEC45057.1 methyltransferase domain-containing protein [Pseudobacter ginsenosidimutans]RZS76552.1 23S rRNA m(1)G-748 methyltransferase [Pseudobacter ginsenosidimutans]
MEKMIPDVLRENPCPVYCPVCQASINSNNTNGFTCLNGHQFDQAAEGFINLLGRRPRSLFKAQYFNTSRKLMATGFFVGLERKLLELLYAEYAVNDSLTILDAGTGEGMLFSNILLCMRWDQYRHQGIGIDHFMPAVKTAARHFEKALWLVADIQKIPLKSGSVDVVLNTLAPANYEEFLRILQPGGLLIKTIPGPEHLKELSVHKHIHGNDHTQELFRQYFGQLQQVRVRFQKELLEEEKDLVLNMPATAVQCEELELQQLSTITIDLIILCGRKAY